MAKGSASEKLNEALEALMAKSESPGTDLDPRIAAMLDLAADLRHLPNPRFKSRLKSELLSSQESEPSVSTNAGKPLFTYADIEERTNELADAPRLVAHDIGAALEDLPDFSMKFIAKLDSHTIGVTRYSTQDPLWERHPGGDEFLHVLDG